MAENWTREQTIVALNVYCKIPFNRASNSNPEIVNAAKLIGRSPSSVKMKVGNFGSFDPELKARGIVGLSNASRLDKEIWEEYCNNWEKLAYDSEKIIAHLENKTIEQAINLNLDKIPEGKERERIVKQRINQSFFRNAVLSSYNNRCCITQLSVPSLLEACHIAGWAEDTQNRLNPSNGLCMNTLFHRAYDQNLLGISPDYEIFVSNRLFDERLEQKAVCEFFSQFHGTKIHLPDKFLPNRELLATHFQAFEK